MIKELAKLKALEFVREQSMGEWEDDAIESDADKLAALLLEFAELASTRDSGK